MAITAETPIMMPKVVRKERSAFARTAASATKRISRISMV